MAQIQINPEQFRELAEHLPVAFGELVIDQHWIGGESYILCTFVQGHDIIGSFQIAPDGSRKGEIT